ncbi:hypothetical protein NOF04DRAFT_1279069 [Fusarium oxysporum II5]|nr:hypothetical protein NOF04DRAFT_1279069 [Fusarium oxysporum II5]
MDGDRNLNIEYNNRSKPYKNINWKSRCHRCTLYHESRIFTNTHLAKVGDQGLTAMNPGVRKIASGLKDPIGPTSSSEYRILAFWSNCLGGAKTVGAMKREVATTDTMSAEVLAEHGEILDLVYEMLNKAGMERPLT